MRLFILVAVLLLCDAVRPEGRELEDSAMWILRGLMLLAVVMDITEWLKTLFN